MAIKAHNVSVQILTPLLPNHLRIALAGKPLDQTVSIADCDDATLRAVGHQWTEDLLALAAKRRREG